MADYDGRCIEPCFDLNLNGAKTVDRDCPHCIWHTENGCSSWDCEQITRSEARKRLKNGKWMAKKQGVWIVRQCSVCNAIVDHQYNFCPYCGAKMDKYSESGSGGAE